MDTVHPRRARNRWRAVVVFAAATALVGGCSAAGPQDPPRPAANTSPPTAAPSGSGWNGGIDPGTSFTPVFTQTMTVPTAAEASDGALHLAYELLITDATALPMTIERIEVRDASTQRSLLIKSGTTLRTDLTPVSGPRGDEGTTDPSSSKRPGTLGSSETWVVWLDVAVPDRGAVPKRLEHRIAGALQLPGGAPARPFDVVVGAVDTSDVPPPVLMPPVEDGIWYMSEGCCTDDTHHRRGLAPINGTPWVPQRFAIDFFKLDDQQRTWIGDPSKLTSYLSYRQPVVAAAAGTVVRARDGIPNTTSLPEPPTPPKIDQTVGNHVIVEIDPGIHVLYAHFDTGSVKVRVGQQVAAGEMLGLIGSSGNSTTPHLHFQILTTPTYFPSDSRPYVFDQFDLLGRVPDRLWDDNLGLEPTGKLPFVAAAPGGPRNSELPLDRTVVRFGGGR